MPRNFTAAPGTVAEQFWAMDSEIVAVLPDDRAEALERVRDLFEEWEATLSRFRTDSGLSRLNRSAGRVVAVSEPLLGVLRQALAAARATGGIFDPTIGANLSQLGYSTTFEALPDVAVVSAPAEPRTASWRDVQIGPLGFVRMPSGLTIDLGGIAKGMAVDAACAELAAAGVSSALLSAGGDLAVHGLLPDGSPWPIAVERATGSQTVALRSGALATSSTEKRRWQSTAGPMHHLIDPRTSQPATSSLVRVTVHAETCEQAEVAAKTALILGIEEGTAFLERNGLAGLLSTRHASYPVGAWPDDGEEAAA